MVDLFVCLLNSFQSSILEHVESMGSIIREQVRLILLIQALLLSIYASVVFSLGFVFGASCPSMGSPMGLPTFFFFLPPHF